MPTLVLYGLLIVAVLVAVMSTRAWRQQVVNNRRLSKRLGRAEADCADFIGKQLQHKVRADALFKQNIRLRAQRFRLPVEDDHHRIITTPIGPMVLIATADQNWFELYFPFGVTAVEMVDSLYRETEGELDIRHDATVDTDADALVFCRSHDECSEQQCFTAIGDLLMMACHRLHVASV